MTKNINLTYLGIPFSLMLIDLAIKYRIINNMKYEQHLSYFDVIAIARIENFGTHLGPASFIINVIVSLVMLILYILFIRVQIINIDKAYKLATAFILWGWSGNLFDGFLFGKEEAYQYLDYIYINKIFLSFTNISTLMVYAGWVLLLIAVIKRPKELKLVYSKSARA